MALWKFLIVAGLPGLESLEGGDTEAIRARLEIRLREDWSTRRAAQTNTTLPASEAVENAWKLGRACFELAEFSSTTASRSELAKEGIEACRKLLLAQPKQPWARYYLGVNLGQLARTKTLGALSLVDEMEKHFQMAIDLDPKIDHGGPDRALGLLYFEAPGWPVSVGNRAKARKHLARAVEIGPGFPENSLCLMEALLKWQDHPALEKAAAGYAAMLPSARSDYKGEVWEWSWTDWDSRWDHLQNVLRKRALR